MHFFHVGISAHAWNVLNTCTPMEMGVQLVAEKSIRQSKYLCCDTGQPVKPMLGF